MDNAGMVAMFEALVASGLNGFLGCMSDIHESALVEFYQNASVRDGKVISTVQGKLVEISEEAFARTFQLPVEGLADINEVPKDLIFDARTEFSFAGEQLTTSCKKRELKIEYRLLNDILAKSITVKAGSFDAVTHERFLMMTAIFGGVLVNWGRLLFKIFKDMVTPESRQATGYAVQICVLLKKIPNLELGDSEEFPPLKILTVRTVGRYIAINDKITVEDVEGVAVAQEAIPLQIVEPIQAEPDVLPSKPKQKAPKRRLKLPAGSDDDVVRVDAQLANLWLDRAVKMRIRPPEFETSICDAKYHVSLSIAALPLLSLDRRRRRLEPPPPPPRCRRKFVCRQLFEENPIVLISSGLLVQSDEGVPNLVVDRIDESTAINREAPDSPPTSADSSLHFNANDIPTEEDSANAQLILPSTSTDISASFATLRESISILVANRTRDSRRSGDAHGEVMSKINHVERVLLDSLAVKNQAFRGLIRSILQEAHNDKDVLSIALKAVRAQNAILSTDLADVRQEVKDLKAELSKDFDNKLAVIRNDLLEFRVETQGQLASLGTNLAELIAFITKGSDDKKGEVSSSHGRGQPPPDDQNRPSRGGGGSSGSIRRDERRDSSNRRSSSGGGGSGAGGETYGPYGPYKKNAEWWLYGKNQF
ncbi:hypothetical protein F511_26223 [Dorcoceras hygrometricum]|uniref:Dystroglycan-like n=1 Tax=Dorcoceras hygrometricum TaxID=472368 RepID=A0A2Z7B7N9_9LAMI|nr:hypothetical protein F511_26223 [Dorcoceras hygrometricum]